MSGLLETIRNLRRSRRDLSVCPKCGSARIRNSSWMNGWILPDQYTCDDCGYTGYILLELEREE